MVDMGASRLRTRLGVDRVELSAHVRHHDGACCVYTFNKSTSANPQQLSPSLCVCVHFTYIQELAAFIEPIPFIHTINLFVHELSVSVRTRRTCVGVHHLPLPLGDLGGRADHYRGMARQER